MEQFVSVRHIMEAILRAGLNGRVLVPPKERFHITITCKGAQKMPEICDIRVDFSLEQYLSDPPESVALSDYDGKVILLSFMNIGTGAALAWISNMQDIHDHFASEPDIQVLGVVYNYADASPDPDNATITAKLADAGITTPPEFPVLMDPNWLGSVAKTKYDVTTGGQSHYSYIISKRKKIINKWNRYSTVGGEDLPFDSADLDATEAYVINRLDEFKEDRDPSDAMLALDFSGSMRGHVTLDSGGGSTITKSKADFLKEATRTLLQVWKDWSRCADRVGVVTFDNGTAGTLSGLVPILQGANADNLAAQIESRAASGYTAMGAGLATALDEMTGSSPDTKKFAVLFTDGVQNRNPLVYTFDHPPFDPIVEIDDLTPADAGALTPPVSFVFSGDETNYTGSKPVVLDYDAYSDTRIYTIGFGGGPFQQTLEEIASHAGGQYTADTTIWPNVKHRFLEMWAHMYSGSRAHVVRKLQGVLEANHGEVVVPFTLDKSVKMMTSLVSWLDETKPLTFTLRKGGMQIDLTRKVKEDTTFRFATLRFPHYQGNWVGGTIMNWGIVDQRVAAQKVALEMIHGGFFETFKNRHDADGGWELVIRRAFPDISVGIRYSVMILAKDDTLDWNLTLPQKVFEVKEAIPIALSITDAGEPVDKIHAIDVSVRRPTRSTVDVLKRKGLRTHEELQEFLEGEELLEALGGEPQVDRFRLEPSRREHETKVGREKRGEKEKRGKSGREAFKGRYEYVYRETGVDGIYQVDMRIRGIGKRCGSFERTESRTFLVGFPSANDLKGIMKST